MVHKIKLHNMQQIVDLAFYYTYSLIFQVNEKEAVWISVGVFAFSCSISIPFIIFTKLQRMFYEPGAYDHIAFCVENLSQQAQVRTTSQGRWVLQLLKWGDKSA